jgi:tRNA(Ile)-lysidine synthase
VVSIPNSLSAIGQLHSACALAWPPERWRDLHVLAAVSGGADSVALLRAMRDLKQQAGGRGQVFAAHFNHHLRGEHSDADARWVAELGESLGVEVILGQAGGGSDSGGLTPAELNSEELARDARYAFLLQTAERLGARFVATGHTADDQTETILHRLLRGASIGGLAGIPPSRPLGPTVEVVRPLLGVTRQAIEQALAEWGQDYRTDATNAEATFTRNRLRHMVLPLLREEFGPGIDDAIRRLGRQAGESHEVIRELATRVLESAIFVLPDQLVIQKHKLTSQPPLVVREACKLAWRAAGWPEQAMGASEWNRLHDFLVEEGPPAAISLPGGVEARRDDRGVVLAGK